jgi:hypothetical protein
MVQYGFSEYDNDPLGSIRVGEFIDYISDYQFLNEGSVSWS